MKHAIVAAILTLVPFATFADEFGPCPNCSHRGKGGPIIEEHVANPWDYHPYSGNMRADGSMRGGKGYAIVSGSLHATCATRYCAPYTAEGMQHLDGETGSAGHSTQTGGHR